jgi:hypothetical protein
MGSTDREALLRETYRLNHELGYIGFRHQYFNDLDEIKEWPDPAMRERALRNFWDKQWEGGYASYYTDFARYSVNVLAAYCDYLRELWAGDRDGQIAYYNQVSEHGRSIRLSENGFGEVKATEHHLASPSEIARDTRPAAPEQGNGQHVERGRGR